MISKVWPDKMKKAIDVNVKKSGKIGFEEKEKYYVC